LSGGPGRVPKRRLPDLKADGAGCELKARANSGLPVFYEVDYGPVAVDHHCSYRPRAGQEHMHNRVAFHTQEFPYANMDGYERLIAFKTSPDADVAVGQVESERLRRVEKLPPEIWHEDPCRPRAGSHPRLRIGAPRTAWTWNCGSRKNCRLPIEKREETTAVSSSNLQSSICNLQLTLGPVGDQVR
jgi:hypothetical protein